MDLGKEICGDLPAAEQREWLVTNGLGGFAMGTVPGLLTRRYHGLLVAALNPPLGRTLLLTKIDETVQYLGQDVSLFANRWLDGTVEPQGYIYLERFHLEGATPVWSYAIADARLEKRIWMEKGSNTTYIQYTLRRASGPLAISAKALVNYRDYHQTSIPFQWNMEIDAIQNGLRFLAFDGATPFFLMSGRANWFPRAEWYEGYHLSAEAYRGQEDFIDANLYAGHCNFHLGPGLSVTLVASTEDSIDIEGASAYKSQKENEARLLRRANIRNSSRQSKLGSNSDLDEKAIPQLVLAADQFIVERSGADVGIGRSIIAGYPWFSDWGRDTMIALPGLTLFTGRTDDAAKILHTFSRFVDRGQLPNRFPDVGEEPEYNTVDATLWYFEAVRAYHTETGDIELISNLYPVLEEIVQWHIDGTRYNIKLDPIDGLIYAGQAGVQLTWMDAKIGDWIVTPRVGKPIEVNALWYNALNIMVELSDHLKKNPSKYANLAGQTRNGFIRYWNDESGYCYDLLDGPDGHDPSLRPNQLLAVSLPYTPLTAEQQKSIVDICSQRLATSFGLRSLAMEHRDYIGAYGGNQKMRDGAYHQGTVWGWLIGPYLSAHLKVYNDKGFVKSALEPFFHHLSQHGVGSISEIFDGDPPHTPRGCPAQAWSVAEVLRVWGQINKDSEKDPPRKNSHDPANH